MIDIKWNFYDIELPFDGRNAYVKIDNEIIFCEVRQMLFGWSCFLKFGANYKNNECRGKISRHYDDEPSALKACLRMLDIYKTIKR